ncbi:MAG: effector-associated domain EAD1-containing protein [Myxococcota bacterium]
MDGEATFGRVEESAPDPHAVGEFAELVGELASVFVNEGEARVLLRAAGFPKNRVPKFTTALVYWTEIVTTSKNGVLDGVLPIAKAAVALYPHNKVFVQYCETAGTSSSRTAYKVIIKIDHMTIGEIGEFLEKIQRVAGDESISLERIERGSIILTLRMDDKTATRLSDLSEEGELSKLVGYRISEFTADIEHRLQSPEGNQETIISDQEKMLNRQEFAEWLNRLRRNRVALRFDIEEDPRVLLRIAKHVAAFTGLSREAALKVVEDELDYKSFHKWNRKSLPYPPPALSRDTIVEQMEHKDQTIMDLTEAMEQEQMEQEQAEAMERERMEAMEREQRDR